MQGLLQGITLQTLLLYIDSARLVDGHGQGLCIALAAGGGIGLGEVYLHGAEHHGRGDDENHQQHQHHVNQRRHIDVAHGRIAALGLEAPESHGLSLVQRAIRRIGRRLALVHQQFAHIAGKTLQVGLDTPDQPPQQVVA